MVALQEYSGVQQNDYNSWESLRMSDLNFKALHSTVVDVLGFANILLISTSEQNDFVPL